jgi:hypothetical protein
MDATMSRLGRLTRIKHAQGWTRLARCPVLDIWPALPLVVDDLGHESTRRFEGGMQLLLWFLASETQIN